ncbi:zf-TFIIB domain-containing protein [Ornithinibacillus sp. 4-3]|uniref:Zf-TFIIB domain-containing protein n=1 Tax=Ornithinibacillus sp. 4-3 TaxID=3231488 RepID=A0AB39HMM3_9BACI
MNCPVCDDIRMREVDKEGVTIDVCPQCKGVWLDRGELDKLMGGMREIRDDFNDWHRERYKDDYYRKDDSKYYHKKKRKKNFLDRIGDIFD